MAIKSTIDAEYVQQHLDKPGISKRKWKMAFHPAKCNVGSVNRNKNPIKFNYTLHGHPLESLEEANIFCLQISIKILNGKVM